MGVKTNKIVGISSPRWRRIEPQP